MDLIEAEDIKKRWQEYTEELHKKHLHDPDNHDGVITHWEPDILECEVRWALGSISTNKASGDDRIPVELFQILKDDAVKVLHSICQQIWKTHQWPQDWKKSVFTLIPKKGNTKDAHTTIQLHSSQTLVKWCSKFSKPGFSNMWTVNFQMFKAGLRKGRGTRDQIANIRWIIKKAREFQKKHLFLLYWLCQSLWLCGSQ